MRRGLFITFEGPEGSGKTTQAGTLAARLRALGYEVVQTREPGGTRLGEVIRDVLQHDASGEPIAPETETLLFAASRAHLVQNVILPALERGACVVSDRFADSTTAYQGYGRNFDIDDILAINSLATRGATPDLTILMDVEVVSGLARMEARNRRARAGQDRIEREGLAFHQRVRDGYLALARRWPERIKVVDSSREPAAVGEDIWRIVGRALPARDGVA